jgi:hypothetical protein
MQFKVFQITLSIRLDYLLVMHLPFEFPIDATFLKTKLKNYEMPSPFLGNATWNSKFDNLNNKQNFPT